MSTYTFKDLVWKKDKLYLEDKHLLTVVPDTRFPSQWRIRWPNNIFSVEHYNYSRVKENAVRICTSELNNTKMDRGYDLECPVKP